MIIDNTTIRGSGKLNKKMSKTKNLTFLTTNTKQTFSHNLLQSS